MFSKSKRFPEAPKDYVPGPGEYNVAVDDISKHKRYGFLNHTLRFTDGPVEFPSDSFSGTDSSSTSVSSETQMSSSSNRTDDARTRRHMSEMATQFERYRLSMQKEIDALQAKNRKLETHLQSTVADKESTHATLLNKEKELVEMRLKNVTLQKTLTRLEKGIDRSPTVMQLQKRVGQLEQANNESAAAQQRALEQQAALESTLAERDSTISILRQQAQQQSDTIAQLDAQLRDEKEHVLRLENEHKAALASAQEALQTATTKLAELELALHEKSVQMADMQDHIHKLQQELEAMRLQTATLEDQMQHMAAQHSAEMDACHLENSHLKRNQEQLEAELQTKQHALTQSESHLRKQQLEMETLQENLRQKQSAFDHKQQMCQLLQKQFELHRALTTRTMHALRERQLSSHGHHYDSQAERLAAELLDAKKFINHQALHLDGLKSDLHWMSKYNASLWHVITALQQDGAFQRHTLATLIQPANTTASKVSRNTKVSFQETSSRC